MVGGSTLNYVCFLLVQFDHVKRLFCYLGCDIGLLLGDVVLPRCRREIVYFAGFAFFFFNRFI